MLGRMGRIVAQVLQSRNLFWSIIASSPSPMTNSHFPSSSRGSFIHHNPSQMPKFFYASPRKKKQKKKSKDEKRKGLPESELRFDMIPLQEKKQNFVLRMKAVLMKQPEQVVEMSELGKMRPELGILRKGKSRKVAGLVRKYPGVFELYKDEDNRTWCGFTEEAEKLLEEEKRVLEAYEPQLVRNVRKLLMMSVDKRMLVDKIVHVRHSLGLPHDFRENLLSKYPEFFCVKNEGGRCYLELTSWDSSLAVTALERKAQEACREQGTTMGEDEINRSLRFPWIFKKAFMPKRKRASEIEAFQSAPYISPYKNSPDLQLPEGSLEVDKFAVAVLHEFLSMTVERRCILEQLGQFQKEYRLPATSRALLLRHDGIFYVIQKEPKSLVFLKEAYKGSYLIEKGPLVLWKERFMELALPPLRSKIRQEDDSDASSDNEDLETDLSDEID